MDLSKFRPAADRLTDHDNYIIPAPAFSWESQAVQYAVDGEPGIALESHYIDLDSGVEILPHMLIELDNVTKIDCLLHRDKRGILDGILNHYDGKCELEVKDAVNIWVRADAQRQGIATALIIDALERWPGIADAPQRFTPEGIGLVQTLLSRARGTL